MTQRTQGDIGTLATYIRSLKVDVLALQEVSETGDVTGNDVPDWQDLLNDLGPKYAGQLGKSGGSRRLGFIWKKAPLNCPTLAT